MCQRKCSFYNAVYFLVSVASTMTRSPPAVAVVLLCVCQFTSAAVPPRLLPLPDLVVNFAATTTPNNSRKAAPPGKSDSGDDRANDVITTPRTRPGKTNVIYRIEQTMNMDFYNGTPASLPGNVNVTLFTASGVLVPNHSATGSDSGAVAMRVSAVRPWSLFRQSTTMVVVLTIAYFVVFLLGIVNNSLVVSVVYRNRQMRTVTNYFIANLAIADILVCILVLPITLLSNVFQGEFAYVVICHRGIFHALNGVTVLLHNI